MDCNGIIMAMSTRDKKRGASTVKTMTMCRRRYLRGSCREGCHPGLEHAPPETERVLADNDQVNQGEDGELVEEDSGDYSDDEHCQLGHDESEIGYAQDLGANDATDTNRRNPKKGTGI